MNTTTVKATLIYAHDPMCSWCWGFKPVWLDIKEALPENVNTKYVLGGLAPDTSEPMPEQMQHMLQQTWQRIAQTIPGTQFNFDFWVKNKPRRSTYPACRAVIAARAQNPTFEEAMISAIQSAYYTQAKNPSDDDILVSLAGSIGCDEKQFEESLNSSITNKTLGSEIEQARRIGAQGFPSLFLEKQNNAIVPIAISHTQSQSVLEQIDYHLAS